MTQPQTLEMLKKREAQILKRLADRSASKQSKRHNKRALVRVREQIKEKE